MPPCPASADALLTEALHDGADAEALGAEGADLRRHGLLVELLFEVHAVAGGGAVTFTSTRPTLARAHSRVEPQTEQVAAAAT